MQTYDNVTLPQMRSYNNIYTINCGFGVASQLVTVKGLGYRLIWLCQYPIRAKPATPRVI